MQQLAGVILFNSKVSQHHHHPLLFKSSSSKWKLFKFAKADNCNYFLMRQFKFEYFMKKDKCSQYHLYLPMFFWMSAVFGYRIE